MTALITEGAEALRGAGSIGELTSKLGVDRRTVSAWRAGAKLPNPASRELMQRELAIPLSAWERRAAEPAAAAPAPPPQVEERPAAGSAEDRLRAQLERLRQQRQAATGRTLVDLERLELAASRALARAEGVELDGRRIVRSRAWESIEVVIVRALEPWPQALAAVATALQEHANGAA